MGGGNRPTAAETKRKRCVPPGPTAAPWLVIPYLGKGNKEHQAFYNICEPNNTTCRRFIPELSGTNFYQKPSHQGWLIILCYDENYDYTPWWNYGDCFLWNPVTTETIQLPTLLDWVSGDNYEVVDCVLSSPPKNNMDSMVFFVLRPHGVQDDDDEYDHVCLMYCRPGEKEWREHILSRDNITNLGQCQYVLSFRGKLYVLDKDFHHQEIDVNDDLTISVKPFHVKRDVAIPVVGGETTYRSTSYVEFPDELYKVDILRHDREDSEKEVVSIEVKTLNFSVMEWEKVNSLGQRVLFVGCDTTAGCLAADLGLTSGCLYYLLPEDQSLYKFQIESTGNAAMLPIQDLDMPTEWFTSSEWIMMPDDKQGREKTMSCEEGEICILRAPETKTGTMSIYDENQGEAKHARYGSEIKEVASSWNIINDDIVQLIGANYLHGLDYKHFRSVCKANRGLLPKVKPTSYLSPWLVYSGDHNYTIYSVVNPMYHNENYAINLSDLAGATIRFQKGGWLLMTRMENIFFYNPFTRETVKLPDMYQGYCYSVVSCSCLPTSSDCIVFAMDYKTDVNQVYIDFIRRGEAEWSFCIFDNTNTERYMPLLNTAVFHEGAFFCIDYNGTLGVFSVLDYSWKVLEKPHKQSDSRFPGFLVECGGDHLLVKLGFLGEPASIYKLNFSEMEWVEVEGLGEHTLFISHTSCISAVAPNSDMKNNIYFPRLYLKDGGIVFYSLETRSYHSLARQHSAKDLYDTEGWFVDCTWIEPNMSKFSTQELDWLDSII